MKYIVLCAGHVNQLEQEVNKHIADGWEPQGGAFTTGYTDKPFGRVMLKSRTTDGKPSAPPV